jgi:Tol biopolymer transport system component
MNYGYDWSASGEEVYLDGWFEPGNHGIYKFNLSTKILTPIIQSDWHDRDPSRSPDETKIAFISDRSGEYELWIYDMTDSKYIQVTGEASYHFDSRYTSLQWLSNEEMLITIFEDSKSKAVKIKVN